MEEFWSIADHAGAHYSQLLGQIHLHLKPKSYLEIGVETGATLALAACPSIAVDPHFQINRNITGGKPLCCLFQMKSDDFFQRYNPQAIVGPIGLAFLDGMHLFEYTLRDFIYTERYAAPNSVILLHDCIPTDAYIARRAVESQAFQGATLRRGWWAGDVWKVVAILKRYRPDLTISAFNAPPTGLIAVTNLDPRSDRLPKAYREIVAEYERLTLFDYGVEKYLHSLEMVDTSVLFNAGSEDPGKIALVEHLLKPALLDDGPTLVPSQ